MSREHAPAGYDSYGEPVPSSAKNGAGVAGLVLGIVALLLCWAVVGLPLSIVGLVLSIVGLRRVGRGRATNRGVAITGLVVNVVALLVGAVLTALYAAAVGVFWNNGGMDALNCLLNADGDQAVIQSCVDRYDG
jgi:hypothetical protein